jgi:hypothetical protein
VSKPRGEARQPPYTPTQHRDGAVASWSRSVCDRALVGARVRRYDADIPSRRHAAEGKGSVPRHRANGPSGSLPTGRPTARIPGGALIMPNCRMAGGQQVHRSHRPCGIIRITALCVLCRYRHKAHGPGQPSGPQSATRRDSQRAAEASTKQSTCQSRAVREPLTFQASLAQPSQQTVRRAPHPLLQVRAFPLPKGQQGCCVEHLL